MGGWRDGGMEGWGDGGMEGWRDGGMEGWRDGFASPTKIDSESSSSIVKVHSFSQLTRPMLGLIPGQRRLLHRSPFGAESGPGSHSGHSFPPCVIDLSL